MLFEEYVLLLLHLLTSYSFFIFFILSLYFCPPKGKYKEVCETLCRMTDEHEDNEEELNSCDEIALCFRVL
jgi:hypothetical protein